MTNKLQISASRIKCFDQCPYLFKLRYVQGLDSVATPGALSFGTAVDNAMQKYLKVLSTQKEKFSQSDLDEIALQSANDSIGDHFRKITSENVDWGYIKVEHEEYTEDMQSIAKEMILNFHNEHSVHAKGWMDIQLQREINFESNLFVMNGYLDLLYRDPKNNAWMIADFKTTQNWYAKSPGKPTIGKMHEYYIQLAIYSLGLHLEKGDWHGKYVPAYIIAFVKSSSEVVFSELLSFCTKDYENILWAMDEKCKMLDHCIQDDVFPPRLDLFFCRQFCIFARHCWAKREITLQSMIDDGVIRSKEQRSLYVGG